MRPIELDAFEYAVPVFYCDVRLREVMMIAHGENVPLNFDVDLRQLAEMTEWWSGRELMELMLDSPLNEQAILTNDNLLAQVKLKGSNIVPELRAKRMRELLMFTADHCTSQTIREDIKWRFGPDFIVSKDKVPTIQPTEIHVSQKFVINQPGVVVAGGEATNFTVNQSLSGATDLDLNKLATELAVLVASLRDNPNDGETREPAIRAVAAAHREAEKGNGAGVLENLSKAGEWVLNVATKIGVPVAAEAIKRSLGL